jgi:hypothetical protein
MYRVVSILRSLVEFEAATLFPYSLVSARIDLVCVFSCSFALNT